MYIVGCVWPWTVMWSVPNICIVLCIRVLVIFRGHLPLHIYIYMNTFTQLQIVEHIHAWAVKLDALVSIGIMRAAEIMHGWCYWSLGLGEMVETAESLRNDLTCIMLDTITLALPVIVRADQCCGTTDCFLYYDQLCNTCCFNTGRLWLLGGGLHSIYNSL